MATATVTLPKVHTAQAQLLRESLRFNVLECGRRFGKTTLGMILVCMMACKGFPVAWYAPNYKALEEVWRETTKLLKAVAARVDQQTKRIDLYGGGVIEFWTLDDPDNSRGRKYKLVVLDECSVIRNLARCWEQTIRATLTDFAGSAWFLATPQGHNYFHGLFKKGTRGDRGWIAWRRGTKDNPYIPAAEVDEAERDLPRAVFEQEFLGIPTDADTQFFRGSIIERQREAHSVKEPRRCTLDKGRFFDDPKGCWWLYREPRRDASYAMGADISHGTGNANSVLAVFDREDGGLVAEYVDPQILPHDLAKMAHAAGSGPFAGQLGQAFFNWEVNGPGQGFHKMLLALDYHHLYFQRREGTRGERRTRKYGWTSTKSNKESLLRRYHASLDSDETKIRSLPGLDEHLEYVVYDEGSIGPGLMRDESSGARASHGDRVIAYATAYMALAEAPKFERPAEKKLDPYSIGAALGMDKVLDMDQIVGAA